MEASSGRRRRHCQQSIRNEGWMYRTDDGVLPSPAVVQHCFSRAAFPAPTPVLECNLERLSSRWIQHSPFSSFPYNSASKAFSTRIFGNAEGSYQRGCRHRRSVVRRRGNHRQAQHQEFYETPRRTALLDLFHNAIRRQHTDASFSIAVVQGEYADKSSGCSDLLSNGEPSACVRRQLWCVSFPTRRHMPQACRDFNNAFVHAIDASASRCARPERPWTRRTAESLDQRAPHVRPHASKVHAYDAK